MPSYKVVGIDFSLTSPGMACMRVEDGKYFVEELHNTKTDSDTPWFERQRQIVTEIVRFVFRHKPERICIENYSFGSQNGRELAGEVHGIVLFKLFELGFPPSKVYRVVAPSQLKKFITGRGQKVTKGEVVKAVNEFFQLNLKVKDNDMADALVLAYIAYCMLNYDYLEPTLTQPQKEVMKKLKNQVSIGGI